ncbi:hypothetical protein RIF29_07359 [Crotalaria pallida]|uniref:Uncharacterized protein n=1 Tax=Crotalaria pallida TaxID=3830 RepID=A0AAN9J420_CROPI
MLSYDIGSNFLVIVERERGREDVSEIVELRIERSENRELRMVVIRMMKNLINKGLNSYNANFIQTNSGDPIYHVCFIGMAFSYLVALPHELRHIEHLKHANHHDTPSN